MRICLSCHDLPDFGKTILSHARTLSAVLEELHFVTSEQVRQALREKQVSMPLGALLGVS
jgi:hypothetical protein